MPIFEGDAALHLKKISKIFCSLLDNRRAQKNPIERGRHRDRCGGIKYPVGKKRAPSSTGRMNVKIAHSIEEAMQMVPMPLPNISSMQGCERYGDMDDRSGGSAGAIGHILLCALCDTGRPAHGATHAEQKCDWGGPEPWVKRICGTENERPQKAAGFALLLWRKCRTVRVLPHSQGVFHRAAAMRYLHRSKTSVRPDAGQAQSFYPE